MHDAAASKLFIVTVPYGSCACDNKLDQTRLGLRKATCGLIDWECSRGSSLNEAFLFFLFLVSHHINW